MSLVLYAVGMVNAPKSLMINTVSMIFITRLDSCGGTESLLQSMNVLLVLATECSRQLGDKSWEIRIFLFL